MQWKTGHRPHGDVRAVVFFCVAPGWAGDKGGGCVNALAQVDIGFLFGQYFRCCEAEVFFAHGPRTRVSSDRITYAAMPLSGPVVLVASGSGPGGTHEVLSR